ncbi:MAG: DUF2157 domain-containing protein [Terracidiphilus sp.]|jgi:uncharacterized membrane protein
MADFEAHLTRWQSAGLLDAELASRIRAYESEQKKPAGLRWQVIVVLILGAILLGCGVALFVNAHWEKIGSIARLAIVFAMVSLFHLGGGWAREQFKGLSTALHAVGTLATGAAIALVGQIFNIQEHWPAAILMWAVAALAGWILLHDEAQQTLTLLLFPAWILSEFSYYAEGHIGEQVYVGRFLIVWAVLYLTFFIGSKHKAVPILSFIVGAVAASVGIGILLEGWRSWGDTIFLPLGLRTWGWVDIAAIPLLFALFKFRKSVLPVVVALCFSIALPFCQRTWTESYESYNNGHYSYVRTEPSLIAHSLVAAFAIFVIWWGFRQLSQSLAGLGVIWFAANAIWFSNSHIFGNFSRVLIAQILEAAAAIFVIWWGVRLASKWLVNIGIAGFAVVVIWFYFADIFDKLDRSLALIGLGILFLAGGWALEKTRRNLVGGMKKADVSAQEAL